MWGIVLCMDIKQHKRNLSFEWLQADGPYRRVTNEQAQQYAQLGGFVLQDAFDKNTIKSLVDELDQFEQQANEALADLPTGQPTISRHNQIVFNAHLVNRSEKARKFTCNQVFVDLCNDLIGQPTRLYWDQLVYKRPGTEANFPWHQDNGYTYVEPQQYLTCWVALTDATVDNGCPWIAPGLHKSGTLAHQWSDLGFVCFDDDPDNAMPLEVSAGSIAVFSSLTPHRTGPNLTDDIRKSYIVQFAPDGAMVYPSWGETNQPFAANDEERQFLIT